MKWALDLIGRISWLSIFPQQFNRFLNKKQRIMLLESHLEVRMTLQLTIVRNDTPRPSLGQRNKKIFPSPPRKDPSNFRCYLMTWNVEMICWQEFPVLNHQKGWTDFHERVRSFTKDDVAQGFVKAAVAKIFRKKTSWWFQPIWKILVKLDPFPK